MKTVCEIGTTVVFEYFIHFTAFGNSKGKSYRLNILFDLQVGQLWKKKDTRYGDGHK